MNQIQDIAGLVREAGRMARAHFERREFSRKPDGSLVTPADGSIEEFLRQKLSTRCPAIGFLGEESGRARPELADRFILDPLDGTAAFASGLPIWGPCLGLWRNQRLEAGWFSMPMLDELYVATADGVTRNQKIIRPVSPVEPLLLAPSDFHRRFLTHGECKVRSFRSTAAHLLFVALGRASAGLFGQVHIWDVAGVIPALEACRGSLLHLDGRPVDLSAAVATGRFSAPFLALAAGEDPILWRDMIRLRPER